MFGRISPDNELTIDELHKRIEIIDTIYKKAIADLSEKKAEEMKKIPSFYYFNSVRTGKQILQMVIAELKRSMDQNVHERIFNILNDPEKPWSVEEDSKDPDGYKAFHKLKTAILNSIYNYKYSLEVKRDVLLKKRPAVINEHDSNKTLNDLGKDVSIILARDFINYSPLFAGRLRRVSRFWKSVIDQVYPNDIDLLHMFFGPMGTKYLDRSLVSFSQFLRPRQMIARYLHQKKFLFRDLVYGRVGERDPKELDQYELIFLDDNVELFENIYLPHHKSNENLAHGFSSACGLGAINIVRYCLSRQPKEDTDENWPYNLQVNKPCIPDWFSIIKFNHREILKILLPDSKEKFPRKILAPKLDDDAIYIFGNLVNVDLVDLFFDAFAIVPGKILVSGVFTADLPANQQLKNMQHYIDKYKINVDFDLLRDVLRGSQKRKKEIITWYLDTYRPILLENIDRVKSIFTPEMKQSWCMDEDVCQYIQEQLGIIKHPSILNH